MQTFRLVLVASVLLASISVMGFTPPAQQQTTMDAPNKGASRVLSEVVDYTSANGSLQLRGILFRPGSQGPHPAVVFLHGANGVSDIAVATIGGTFADKGYLLFIPFRRGLGLSASSGEAILPRLAREQEAHGVAARIHLMVELLSTEQLDDALGALNYVRSRADVDSSRLAVYGHSYGGILGVLAAERDLGVRAVVAAAPAAQNWAGAADLRVALLGAVRNARVPIFFFQAANDYDLAPTEQLALEMTRIGKPHVRKVYPAWGTSVGEGHNLAIAAPNVWAPDVFGFLSEYLRLR